MALGTKEDGQTDYSSSIVSSFVPSAITQPFFELQTPDFAWKFVWTVPTNYEIFFWSGASEGGVFRGVRG